jgi:cell division protein FtsN
MIKQSRQHGGTLLGMVIGLVIGLAIALVVAMVITKTPIPFVDKAGRHKSAEPTIDQSSDPNRPLYRKRELAPGTVIEAFPAPENTAAPQPFTPDVRIEPMPPAGARIVERSTPEQGETSDDKWQYYLQAGAFREQIDAEGMRAKLALLGVEARLSERQAETGLLYRVRAGPFDQVEAMNRVRSKLSDNGIDAAVVRISR